MVLGDRSDTRLPLKACDQSLSIALALRPHESTSKVPFSCSDHV